MSKHPIFDQLRRERPGVELNKPEEKGVEPQPGSAGVPGSAEPADRIEPAVQAGQAAFLLRRTTGRRVLARRAGVTVSALAALVTVAIAPAHADVNRLDDEKFRTHGAAATEAAARKATTSYAFRSDRGDYIGGGQSKEYTTPTSTITMRGTSRELTVGVEHGPGEWWHIQLAAPHGERLRPGAYRGAERAAFRTGRAPGLDAGGSGKGCNKIEGSFTIEQIRTSNTGEVRSLEASFIQHCEGHEPALRGTVRYKAYPLRYRMVSDDGDYVGGGVTRTYTGASSLFNLTGSTRGVSAQVSGRGDGWSIDLRPPTGQVLEPGKTYTITRDSGDDGPGLFVWGNGRACNRVTGAFTIHDLVAAEDGTVKTLAATFRQHCEGGTPALRGDLRLLAGKFPAATA